MNSLEKDVFHLEILKNQNIFQDVLVKKNKSSLDVFFSSNKTPFSFQQFCGINH